MKAAKAPITLPSAEECELFHLYDKLANPWSEMSSLTKHSKRITLSLFLTQLRNMQFSHCYFTENPSSSRGPTQPVYKKMFEKL